ncbi:MAG: flippase [Ignavibacteriales bacterium CG_4_9_14_3_um_filter_30_11]|nr:MAG: flippase [Ignavibacteriales bacterium CG_4_9_14_3_um_filter_30_11]
MRNLILKYKTQIKNFSSLSILNFSNFIFSFITFPYIVRVIGVEKFGLINFAAAFVAYFGLITDYGFSWSATQLISLNRNEKIELDKNYSTVISIKVLLIILSTILLSIIIFSIDFFRSDFQLYYLSFLFVIGVTLFPNWFFQGIEKMGYIATITIIFRVLSVIAIFVFITQPSDYLLLVGINGFTTLIIGLFAMVFIQWKFKIKFIIPNLKEVKVYLNYSWDYFITNIGISFYTNTNTFILGLFASNNIVGYWAAADKIRNAITMVYSTFNQTLFPYLTKLLNDNIKEALRKVKKIIRYGGVLTLVFSFIIFLFSEEICLLILGSSYQNSILILQIICWLPFLIYLSNIFGIQLMLNLGFKRAFAKIIIVAAVYNLIFSFILVPIYFAIGTAIAVTITEVFVTLATYVFLKKKSYLV